MNSFLHRPLALSLVLLACGPGDGETTMNASFGTTSTTESAITDSPTSSSTSTSTSTSTSGADTTTTTAADTTTSDATTTTSTGAEGSTSTGPVDHGVDEPYVDCSNDPENPVACPEGLLCIDGYNTNGAIFGAFCSPPCVGPIMDCPLPEGADFVNPFCLFGMGMPTQCALNCYLDNDTCPEDMTCEDVGAPQGVCTHPKS